MLLQLTAIYSAYRLRAADVELDAGVAFRLQPPMFLLMQFRPAIPTRGAKVPTSSYWIHEIKYDARAADDDTRSSFCFFHWRKGR